MREPSCILNHDSTRKELTEKGISEVKCPSCGWKLKPYIIDEVAPPLTEEQIEYIKKRLKYD